MPTVLSVDSHPLLSLGAFVTELPRCLGEILTPPEIQSLLKRDAAAPISRSEACRAAVRNLFRHGGYKPTGRGKPASEYLLRAVSDDALSSINLAVDAGNAVSLHSGLPISVIDLDLARAPLRVAVAAPGTRYVFNPTGQEIDGGGLLCLFDAEGPSASGVKDSQRTKTHEATRTTLSLVWGTNALEGHTAAAVSWYRGLLEGVGARTQAVELRSGEEGSP